MASPSLNNVPPELLNQLGHKLITEGFGKALREPRAFGFEKPGLDKDNFFYRRDMAAYDAMRVEPTDLLENYIVPEFVSMTKGKVHDACLCCESMKSKTLTQERVQTMSQQLGITIYCDQRKDGFKCPKTNEFKFGDNAATGAYPDIDIRAVLEDSANFAGVMVYPVTAAEREQRLELQKQKDNPDYGSW